MVEIHFQSQPYFDELPRKLSIVLKCIAHPGWLDQLAQGHNWQAVRYSQTLRTAAEDQRSLRRRNQMLYLKYYSRDMHRELEAIHVLIG